jgi:hypothetical protein
MLHRAGSTPAAIAAVAAILGGCSGASLTASLPSWFTRSSPTQATQASASAETVSKTLDDDCPGVEIRTGTGTLAVAAKTQQPTANDLRYQLTFTDYARQCAVDGGTVRMRVGVQGRAIVGPAGAPPQVSVPLRYAVVREGVEPKTIVTKFRRLSLPLPSGSTNVTFTDIEEDLSFPMPSLVELQAYVVYVGFDELGDRQGPPAKGKAKAKKKAPPKRP